MSHENTSSLVWWPRRWRCRQPAARPAPVAPRHRVTTAPWRRRLTPAAVETSAQGHRRARYQVQSGARLHEVAPERVSWAKASVSPATPRGISSSTPAPSRRAMFEFDQNGNYVREIGKDSTATCSVMACASMPRTTSG